MTLTEYLQSLPGMQTAEPINIRIGRTEYHAVHYWQTRDHNGTTYTQEAIYVLGDLPSCYRRSTHVAFGLDNDTTEWFIASYYPSDTAGEYHPFGRMFLLHPWTVPSGARIDYYARNPYRRVHVAVW